MKKLLVSVLALLAVTAAFAVPGSFKASTGGVLLPSAKIAEATTVSTQFYQHTNISLNGGLDIKDSFFGFNNLQIVLPVGQFVESEALNNLEVSARYDFESDYYNELTIGAKYVLPIELENLSVAVGGQYASIFWPDEINMLGTFTGSNVYGAVTYSLGQLPLSITAGAVYDFDLERIQYGAGAEYDFGVAKAGLEYYDLNPVSGLDLSAFSIYATADLYKGLGATVSYTFVNENVPAIDSINVFSAGLSYKF